MNIADLPARMQSKVREEHGCWIWTGAKNSKGYGSVGVDGKSYLAHRRSYELLVGPIPAGLTIDHLCARKACVNPRHMEPVTAMENIARGNHRPVEPYEFKPTRLSFAYIDSHLTWQCPYKRAIDHYPDLADPVGWARKVAAMHVFGEFIAAALAERETA